MRSWIDSGCRPSAFADEAAPGLVVVGLEHPGHRIGQAEIEIDNIQVKERAAERRRDAGMKPRCGHEDFLIPVRVIIEPLEGRPAALLHDTLGRAEVLVDRVAQVVEVEPPEEAVPVGAVALGRQQKRRPPPSACRPAPRRPFRSRTASACACCLIRGIWRGNWRKTRPG